MISWRSLSKKHIPTIVGLLILAAGLIGGILIVQTTNTQTFLPRASPETTPKNLRITNLSDTSFTVSWITDSKTTGLIKLGTNQNALNDSAGDDRDQTSGTVGLFKTHHVTVKGLKPSTLYYYRISTGSKELYDNNGKPYTTTTTASITPGSQTIYGQVRLSSNLAASGALVYVESESLAPLSGIVQTSGSWVISLAQARTRDNSGAASISSDTQLSFLIIDATDGAVYTSKATFGQAQPVSDIILGAATTTTTTSQTPAPSVEPETVSSKFTAQLLGAPTEVINADTPLSIEYPTTNELVTVAKPEFHGKGAPGTSVTLKISGTAVQNGTTTILPSGVWRWTPTTALKKGKYTLAASATVAQVKQSATVSFSLDTTAVGTPSFVATASATQATATPSATAKATTSATPKATGSAVKTPVTGGWDLTVFLMLIGVVCLGSGAYITLQRFLAKE